MNSRPARSSSAGFTLIELLVVVIVIGILAGIAMPIFLNQRQKGWDTAVRGDLRSAATAQETFLTDQSPGPFATTIEELQEVGFRASPGRNYFGDSAEITVSAVGALEYCLTARSKSGTWFGMGSSTGQVLSGIGIDPVTCVAA